MRTLEEEKHHYQHRHRFSNNRLNIGFKPLEEHLPIWVEENLDYLKKDQDESDNQAKD